MKNSRFSIKEIINLSLSIIAILIALNSFFGLFEFWGIVEKIPALILALIGVLIINSTFERKNELKKIDAKTDKIISITSGDNLKKLEHITQDIPPLLSHIFKDYIDDYHNFFKEAIESETIEFSDLERFKSSYIRTLKYKQSKGTTFYATSLPYKRYFWINNEDITPMIKAMAEFTESQKGNFERIFFLKENDLNDPEVIEVLNTQVDLGIITYIIDSDKVPSNLQKYFVVDEFDELAWEVTIDTKQRINSTKFTTSMSKIKKFKSDYSALKDLDDIKLYKKTKPKK